MKDRYKDIGKLDNLLKNHVDYEKPTRKERLVTSNRRTKSRQKTHDNPVTLAIDQPSIDGIPLLMPPLALPLKYQHEKNVIEDIVKETRHLRALESHFKPRKEKETCVTLKFDHQVILERAPIDEIVSVIMENPIPKPPPPGEEIPMETDPELLKKRLDDAYIRKRKYIQQQMQRLSLNPVAGVSNLPSQQLLTKQRSSTLVDKKIDDKLKEMRQKLKSGSRIVRPTRPYLKDGHIVNEPEPIAEQATISSHTMDFLAKLAKEHLRSQGQPESSKNALLTIKHFLTGSDQHHVDELSGVTHYDKIRIFEYKSRIIPKVEQIIKKIETGQLKDQAGHYFLSVPLMRTNSAPKSAASKASYFMNHNSSLTEPSKFEDIFKGQGQRKDIFIDETSMKIPVDFKMLNDLPFAFKLISFGMLQFWLILVGYLVRSDLLDLGKQDSQDAKTFARLIAELSELRNKPEPGSKMYEKMILLLDKLLCHTNKALERVEPGTMNASILNVMRYEAAIKLHELDGFSSLPSRWGKTSFKETVKHMVSKGCEDDKFIGAIIYIHYLDPDENILDCILGQLHSSNQKYVEQTTDAVVFFYEKNEEMRVRVLEKIMELFEEHSSSVRSNAIQLAGSLVLRCERGQIPGVGDEQASTQATVQKMCEKILWIVWNDWDLNVRKVTSETLAKLGLGRRIFDSIVQEMKSTDASKQMQALQCLSQIGAASPEAIENLLFCLDHYHVPVRIEACKACAQMKELDETVVEMLMKKCLDDDLEVRLHAVVALRKNKRITARIKETLYYLLHYELVDKVKVEAILTIEVLDLVHQLVESLQALRSHSSQTIREFAEQALSRAGYFTSSANNSSNPKEGDKPRELAQTPLVIRPLLYENRPAHEKETVLGDSLVDEKQRQQLISQVLGLCEKKRLLTDATGVEYQQLNLFHS